MAIPTEPFICTRAFEGYCTCEKCRERRNAQINAVSHIDNFSRVQKLIIGSLVIEGVYNLADLQARLGGSPHLISKALKNLTDLGIVLKRDNAYEFNGTFKR